jgi:peptidyl-dipeptidase A
MCTQVNGDDFYTVHHELGHNYYQRAYKDQPFLFKNGANDGFHEAIGDFVGLSALTPTYLNQIGLLQTVPGEDEDIPFLLKMALDKIAFLPFGLMVDRWRWGVFSGETSPAEYNDAWSANMLKYQGWWRRAASGQRLRSGRQIPHPGQHARTPATSWPTSTSSSSSARPASRPAGPGRCTAARSMATRRSASASTPCWRWVSRPWPEAMQAFTGETGNDASAVADYFAPLNAWLTVQNRGKDCGWEA